jgi:hypothetical protein
MPPQVRHNIAFKAVLVINNGDVKPVPITNVFLVDGSFDAEANKEYMSCLPALSLLGWDQTTRGFKSPRGLVEARRDSRAFAACESFWRRGAEPDFE